MRIGVAAPFLKRYDTSGIFAYTPLSSRSFRAIFRTQPILFAGLPFLAVAGPSSS